MYAKVCLISIQTCNSTTNITINLTSFWKTTAALGFNASLAEGCCCSWSRDSICWDLLTSDSSPFGFGDLVISLGWTRWRCQDLVQVPFLFRATALYFPACLGPQFRICKIHRCPFSSRSAKKEIGLHFLCWILGVVPFNTWLISSWEENKCCYELRKCTKWHWCHSKWQKLS